MIKQNDVLYKRSGTEKFTLCLIDCHSKHHKILIINRIYIQLSNQEFEVFAKVS